MSKRRSLTFFAVLLALVINSLGCAFEDGLRDGLTEGTSSALSTLIQAPIEAFVEQAFGG